MTQVPMAMNYNTYRFWEPLLQDLNVGVDTTRFFLERSRNSPAQVRAIIEINSNNGTYILHNVYQLKRSCRSAKRNDTPWFGDKNKIDCWLEMVAVYEPERIRTMARTKIVKKELADHALKLGKATS